MRLNFGGELWIENIVGLIAYFTLTRLMPPLSEKVLSWLPRLLNLDTDGWWAMVRKFTFGRVHGLVLPLWQSNSGSYTVFVTRKLNVWLISG
jgi:hypothetical protein